MIRLAFGSTTNGLKLTVCSDLVKLIGSPEGVCHSVLAAFSNGGDTSKFGVASPTNV